MPSQSAYNLVTFRPSTGRITPADTTFNQVGRVTMIEDATGWKTFKYGKLGDVTEETRSLLLPNDRHPYSFTMRYVYDGFNRIRSMEYPDGEKVSYSYDSGGQLFSVGSRKGGDTVTYIKHIYYNSQGLRRDVFYGNDVVSTYSYDSLQRLNCLTSRYGGGCTQNILYSYDQAGNIVSVTNTADVCDNGLGGTYTNTYKYDDLYRLVNSNGSSNDISSTSYNLDMEYSPAGRILRKFVDANVSTSPNGVEHILKDCHYAYHPEQPHTVKEVMNRASSESQYMLWDANGNLTLSSAKDPRDDRKLCWTEENRLAAVADGNYISHYRYDADGERVLKLWGNTFPMDVNAGESRFTELKEFTIYPSPYVVVDINGYTKHYYAGMERLCCKIGGGGLQDLHEFQVSDSLVKEKENANHQMLKDDLACAGARVETKGLYFEVLNRFIENLSPEEGIYYYHPDHLGSASWITDRNGQPIQHLQYLPYGETKLDQRTGTYSERYTFSGKEKDSETGYYYFGARYYNPDLSLWLSVDPMSDKYPSLSPYNYCAWNPLKLVDPDGKDIWQVDKSGQLKWKEESDVDRIVALNGSYVDVAEGILKRGISYTKDDGHFFLNFENNSDNATEVFEFLADNASVEFSLIGIAKDPLNDNPDRFYLSTSFQPDGDSFGSDYACRASSKNHMRSHTHNHPGDNAPIIPSSILNNGSILVPFANISRGDDLGLANYIKEGSPSCSFNIYHSSKGGEYRPYAICNSRGIPSYDYKHSQVSKKGGSYALIR